MKQIYSLQPAYHYYIAYFRLLDYALLPCCLLAAAAMAPRMPFLLIVMPLLPLMPRH